MNQYKNLIKNIGILAIGKCSTKVISMLLVPLYTSILTTEEYGLFDILQTTINLLMPVLTLNIATAVLRYALDKTCDPKNVFSVGLLYGGISIGVMMAVLLLNCHFRLVPVLHTYAGLFLFGYIVDVALNLVTFFARGLEKMADIAIAGVLGSMAMIICNLLALLRFDLGLTGYYFATNFGLLVQLTYLVVRCRLWRYVGRPADPLRKEMPAFSVPLIPGSIIWCVYNMADRFTITAIWGLDATGVYSVASKIPSIMSVVLSLFNKAWSVSAVKDFDAEDKTGFFSNTYTAYHLLMLLVCTCLIVSCRIIAGFLYANDFFAAWRYVPFLLMGNLFASLSGYLDGIFAAAKLSKLCGRATLLGAGVNILLNILLIPIAGPLAAAVVTAFSYWLVWTVHLHQIQKHVALRINRRRDHLAHGILLLQAVLLLAVTRECFCLYIGEIALSGLICALYAKEILPVLGKLGIGK